MLLLSLLLFTEIRKAPGGSADILQYEENCEVSDVITTTTAITLLLTAVVADIVVVVAAAAVVVVTIITIVIITIVIFIDDSLHEQPTSIAARGAV